MGETGRVAAARFTGGVARLKVIAGQAPAQ
jgi:hypothetical protein